MSDSRIWICPALCGCEISLTADWAEPASTDDKGRTVSYRHPRPFSISSLAIVSTCPAHDALRFAGVGVDPWPDRPGYLTRPIPKASEAESLYVHLWGVHAQNVTLDSCGCVVHQVVDEGTGKISVMQHPAHTKKCAPHLMDDAQHTAALAENRQMNMVKTDLIADDTLARTVQDEDGNDVRKWLSGRVPRVYYDPGRQLRVQLRGITVLQKAALVTLLAKHPVVVD